MSRISTNIIYGLEIFRKSLDLNGQKMYNNQYIYPWHSWIARKTPTLEAAGSNPVG